MSMTSESDISDVSSVCSAVKCPITEALYYKLLLATSENELETFEPECITALSLGLQECIKSVIRVMATEQRVIKLGENLRTENRISTKPYPPPIPKKKFTLTDFHRTLEMYNSQAVGNPNIYYKFMERIKKKLNESTLEKREC